MRAGAASPSSPGSRADMMGMRGRAAHRPATQLCRHSTRSCAQRSGFGFAVSTAINRPAPPQPPPPSRGARLQHARAPAAAPPSHPPLVYHEDYGVPGWDPKHR